VNSIQGRLATCQRFRRRIPESSKGKVQTCTLHTFAPDSKRRLWPKGGFSDLLLVSLPVEYIRRVTIPSLGAERISSHCKTLTTTKLSLYRTPNIPQANVSCLFFSSKGIQDANIPLRTMKSQASATSERMHPSMIPHYADASPQQAPTDINLPGSASIKPTKPWKLYWVHWRALRAVTSMASSQGASL
jgi:hypothetical protein